MSGWVWFVITIALVALVALMAWGIWSNTRRTRLRSRFGPEYDSTVRETASRREAEADLVAREKRRSRLDIRPVAATARSGYADAWQRIQTKFVDGPSDAVRGANALVARLMSDMGYPMADFEQRSADISVDHATVVENYRAARGISMANDRGVASTEDLRQAMVHYRTLFDDLLAYGQVPASADPASS